MAASRTVRRISDDLQRNADIIVQEEKQQAAVVVSGTAQEYELQPAFVCDVTDSRWLLRQGPRCSVDGESRRRPNDVTTLWPPWHAESDGPRAVDRRQSCRLPSAVPVYS